MTLHASVLLAAALLLSLERLGYAWVWRRPGSFAGLAARLDQTPVALLHAVFWGFKALQVAVFVGWCWWWSGGRLVLHPSDLPARVVGLGLLALGQLLNASVFLRLGKTGVFYGSRFGAAVPWCRGFPYSVLEHPQYVGAVLSIWGFFILMRFPAEDWLAIPLIETAYYALSAFSERENVQTDRLA